MQYELERLRPSVSQLVRAVGTIPATTARERLAQSEIAKKVHNSLKLDNDSLASQRWCEIVAVKSGAGTDLGKF